MPGNPEERTQKGKQSLRELNIMLKVKCSKCGLTQLISKDLKTAEEIQQVLTNDLDGVCICGHVFETPTKAKISIKGKKETITINLNASTLELRKAKTEKWWRK